LIDHRGGVTVTANGNGVDLDQKGPEMRLLFLFLPFVALMIIANSATAHHECSEGSRDPCNGTTIEPLLHESWMAEDDAIVNSWTDETSPFDDTSPLADASQTCENGGIPASQCPVEE
jgi:hypothetical protein